MFEWLKKMFSDSNEATPESPVMSGSLSEPVEPVESVEPMTETQSTLPDVSGVEDSPE